MHCFSTRCCVQVFRDAGWDGKTPALPQRERKQHHKHHTGNNAADATAWNAAATAEADEASESAIDDDKVHEDDDGEVDVEDDREVEDEVAAAQDSASTATDSTARSAMPSLEVVKLARAAAVRQQAQVAGLDLGWAKPWWQQQRGMQQQRLRGGRQTGEKTVTS
jgi:hypothetical protein